MIESHQLRPLNPADLEFSSGHTPDHLKTTTPLLFLEGVSRSYRSGESEVLALRSIDFTLYPGEFVAIMGQSGSGKSTLMNILGCLDRPSSGKYLINGRDVSELGTDELAALRRDIFGFVFQRYNLLSTIPALENVEMPAIYAGLPKKRRSARAVQLLKRLGLEERSHHLPSELSGGQQQRVAIARALMNDAPLILADEPTGALDSRSGKDILRLLNELHRDGKAIILITHDEQVAKHADRILHISDGAITHQESLRTRHPSTPLPHQTALVGKTTLGSSMQEAIHMALYSLRANLFRTALTLLGIIIGVCSVVTMLAIGEGSKQAVIDQINAIGIDLLFIRPGAPGARGTGDNMTLRVADAEAIGKLDNVRVVVPDRSLRFTTRQGNRDYLTLIQGVGPGYVEARNWTLEAGQSFNDRDLQSYAPVAVLGQTVLKNLYPEGIDPVGSFILIRNVPFQVIGVLQAKGALPWGVDQDDSIFIPLTTGLVRLFGRDFLSGIVLQVEDLSRLDETQSDIQELLTKRHGTEDFQIRNMTSTLDTAEETQDALSVLLGAVAAISLVVGGIGVMNIMLVNVTERTREIGIRMATGARSRDILVQFNIEAMTVCGLGGGIGVLLGIIIGLALEACGMSIVFTAGPSIMAFSCAFLTGWLFGYWPAQKAAGLDPVAALARD